MRILGAIPLDHLAKLFLSLADGSFLRDRVDVNGNRDLYSVVSECPIRLGLVKVVISTYIWEIFGGIALITLALKLSSIALGVISLPNPVSRYRLRSQIVRITGIIIAIVKYVLAPPTHEAFH